MPPPLCLVISPPLTARCPVLSSTVWTVQVLPDRCWENTSQARFRSVFGLFDLLDLLDLRDYVRFVRFFDVLDSIDSIFLVFDSIDSIS